MLKVVDLCCGAGLFSAGIGSVGLRVVLGVDIDPMAIQSFAMNFPDAMAWECGLEDIASLPSCDVVIGGPPCQPFSPANRSRSDEPDTSLIDKFFHLAKSSGARWVIMEEVTAVRDHADLSACDRVEVIDCSLLGSHNQRIRMFAGSFPDPVSLYAPVDDAAPTVMASGSDLPIPEMRVLQGVPPWMQFVGTDEAVRRQIGNGVPVQVGEAFARGIMFESQGRPVGGHMDWHRTTALYYRESGGRRSYLSANGGRFCRDCGTPL